MQYILILILSLLSTVKVGFQTTFSKKTVKNSADILMFNFFVFLFSDIIFSHGLINSDYQVLVYALIGGLFTALFQLAYTEALSLGNVSLTVMIVNLGMVINVLFSYFVYDEQMSWVRIIGIILTIITFIICTDFKNGKKAENVGGWLLPV